MFNVPILDLQRQSPIFTIGCMHRPPRICKRHTKTLWRAEQTATGRKRIKTQKLAAKGITTFEFFAMPPLKRTYHCGLPELSTLGEKTEVLLV